MLSFSGERGCFIGIPVPGVPNAPAVPVAGTKTLPVAWPTTVAYGPSAPGTSFCTATAAGPAVFVGVFPDIGFAASGNVNFRYSTQGSAAAAPILSCALGAVEANGTAAAGNTGFNTTASANLDGDNNISFWAASNDNGANDCTVGMY